MLSEKMIKALTHQMNREIYSGYLYFGMASYADSIGLKGFASWFKHQDKEELEHALKFYDYLNQKGARAIMEPIEEPPQDFSSGPELFERTLEHEIKVTRLINGLVELAKQESDRETEIFLQWFIKEQAEEEAAPSGVIKKIDDAGRNPEGIKKIDAFLANRK